MLLTSAVEQNDGTAAIFHLLGPHFQVVILPHSLAFSPERVLINGDHFLILFQLFHPIGAMGARVLAESLPSWARRFALALAKMKIISRSCIAVFVAFFFIEVAYA